MKLDRFMRDQAVLCIDPGYVGLASLRPLSKEELAKTGDSEKRQLLVEATLESRNEGASGLVADLTTS